MLLAPRAATCLMLLSSYTVVPIVGSLVSGCRDCPLDCEAGLPAGTIFLNDDGAWSWFESPRAAIHGSRLIVGSVAAGAADPRRTGDIDVIIHDLASGRTRRVELLDGLERDDHAAPAFLVRPDGRLLTVFERHDIDSYFLYRISSGTGWGRWDPVRTFSPSDTTVLTYANLFLLPAEDNRIYDFFRGLDGEYKPSFAYSDDMGETWTTGNIVIDAPSPPRHRPYVRYASNGLDEIHLLYTEGHPRDFDNSIYHILYRDGMLRRSDGAPIRPLTQGLDAPEEGTLVFGGDSDNVAWPDDLELDEQGRPRAVYSVQVRSAGLPQGQGGEDIRYRFARWNGSRWLDYPLAFAGTRLYVGEDDYPGLAALHPDDPDIVYISTNSDPVTGEPLISEADRARHYEIFRGQTGDGGATWAWRPVTESSPCDNLRPIVVPWEPGKTMLLWLRGSYRSYRDYDLAVVGLLSVGATRTSGRVSI